MISIYVHIPFCVKKCDYCAFYSVSASDDLYNKYTDALIRQIDSLNIRESVRTVYFGGGTPSVIGANQLINVLDKIRAKFDLSKCEEITLEINPKTSSLNDLILLRKNGFNRLSIGLQSTHDNLLNSIGRIHTFDDFINTYNNAKLSKFDNISVDLMYGLPCQKLSDHLESLDTITNLDVQHISVYGLTIEPNTKMYKFRNSYEFPDEDEEFEMYLSTSKILCQSGFSHYEISNFSKKGYESKHNTSYWTGIDYLGFGPSAHSFYNKKRFSCSMDINQFIYTSNIVNDYFLYTDYHQQPTLRENELAEEKILLGLRLKDGVKLTPKQALKADIYVKSGYMVLQNDRYSFTPSGWYVSNTIISNILSE